VAILTVVAGGITGSALTYGLTWWRERRRTKDAYRAPQRVAIAEIVAATYELTWREVELSQALGELIRFSEVGPPEVASPSEPALRACAAAFGAELGHLTLAFQVARLAVVDAQCFAAMGEAYAKFRELRGMLADLDEVSHVARARAARNALDLAVAQLGEDVTVLVNVGQERVSPVQSWRNKKARQQASQRLDAMYFEAVPRIGGQLPPAESTPPSSSGKSSEAG